MKTPENPINLELNEVTSTNVNKLIEARSKTDEGKDLVGLKKEAEKYVEGSDRKAFVSQQGEVVTGFVQINLKEDLPQGAPLIDGLSDFAHLARIAVVEEYRGMGIAKNLLAQAELWATQHGKSGMWLDYLSTNEEAEGLYKSCGYENVAEFTDPRKGKSRRIASKRF